MQDFFQSCAGKSHAEFPGQCSSLVKPGQKQNDEKNLLRWPRFEPPAISQRAQPSEDAVQHELGIKAAALINLLPYPISAKYRVFREVFCENGPDGSQRSRLVLV